jgi:hypothetical protein
VARANLALEPSQPQLVLAVGVLRGSAQAFADHFSSK